MLDNYLLEELVTFAQTGTLAKTAATLNVTQPTVTRGMQKLESDLGVQLFDRQPNRLSLTATGKLAATEASALLAANQAAVDRIQNFDRNQRVLQVGATLPGPLIALQSLATQLPANVQLAATADIIDPAQALLANDYALIFTNHPLAAPAITSERLGTERLAVNLNQFMYQANQATITFVELADLSFVVLNDIGPWRAIIQDNIPGAKFFYQEERDALTEITKFSDFPYFSTNVSQFDPVLTTQLATDDKRVCLPITDDAAQMPIYASYLTAEKARVAAILKQAQAVWPD